MPANKKKKKTAANLARGFATVSRPSKAKEVEDETAAVADKSPFPTENNVKVVINQSLPTPRPAVNVGNATHKMTAEELEAHLEESEYKLIVEKHGSRCKQDVSRQVSRLRTERRQSRLASQSHRIASASWLSNDTIDTLLSMQAKSPIQKSSTQIDNSRLPNDEILLVSLWTLKRVLAALKLPDIDNAIRHVLVACPPSQSANSDLIWGLAEALEWYAIRARMYDLHGYEGAEITPASSDVDEVAENHILSNRHSTTKDENIDSNGLETAPISTTEDVELSDLPSSGSDDDDPSLFAERYCQLQNSLFRIEERLKQQKTSKTLSRKSVLLAKIDRLVRDPLFDEYAAQEMWKPRLREIEIEALQAAQKHKKSARSKPTSQDMNGTNESEDDDIMLGIFDAEDQELSAQTSDTSQTIKIIDFGKWSGAQPRKILEDACSGMQLSPKICFTVTSRSSFAVRQRLELKMASSTPIESSESFAIPDSLALTVAKYMIRLEMLSVAATSLAQSESYLSTIMLFLLSTMNFFDQKHYQRLPPVWRSTYQQLVDDQRTMEEREDVILLRGLRVISNEIDQDATPQIDSRSQKIASLDHAVTSQPNRLQFKTEEVVSDQIRSMWQEKASTLAFQNMLLDRKQLPVYNYRQPVLDGIQHNQVVIICADTGAGKSTQIPSFLLEHELSNGRDCRIIVTQPRRISAISLARRVSRELGERASDIGTENSLVGYAIRLESKVSRSTRLTYATTGVLLRMLESSPQLDQIDCLVLDEVHERTMDLDLLFIALRRVQKIRGSLRIVLMSATVDARKFSTYFGGAPVIDIPGRTFPVEIKFLEDAVEQTATLRRGEIGHGGNKQDHRQHMDSDSDSGKSDTAIDRTNSDGDLSNYSPSTRSFLAEMDEYRIDFELVADVASIIATQPQYHKYSSAILIFLPGIAEIRRLQAILLSRDVFARDWVVHLLHSSFSTEDLEKAFVVPPPGRRKIVISTNIAETGITIPDVTAVIDTCKEKIMRFDERRQVSKLREGFISRSSARQRKGRAARVQEGICFHLVTRNRYQHSMLEQHVPEMLRMSLQDAILRIKVWNMGSIEDTLSAAIDPPTMKNVRRAVSKLKDTGALSANEDLTSLGRQLSKLPLEVVLGKLAIYGIIFKCLDSILTIIAAISSKSPFQANRVGVPGNPRAAFARGDSDLLATLNAYEGWYKAREAGLVHQYCHKHFLNHHSLSAIEDQKTQLFVNLADAGLLDLTSAEKNRLRTGRLGRGVERRTQEPLVPPRFSTYEHDSMLCTIFAIAFYPRILTREGRGWRNIYSNQQMSLASSSIHRGSEKPPKWLCYYEAMQSKSGALTVHETSKIPDAALLTVVGGEATFKFFSGTVDIDNGRLKFSLGDWGQVAALKAIREHVHKIVDRYLERPESDVSAEDEVWMHSWVKLVTGQPPKKP